MIVPGVLNGSQGALYYPVDEVKKNPGIWNGVPVTVGHPYDLTGNNVSARDPKIEKQFRIGTVYNDRFENGKRKAEVWLDEDLTKNKSPEIYKSASAGVPIERSTGLFTDNEQVENGKAPDGRPYDYVARNYRPDHLAILPNQTGACSLKDGCGLNVNELQVDNCGGEGGTPGPCSSASSEKPSVKVVKQPKTFEGEKDVHHVMIDGVHVGTVRQYMAHASSKPGSRLSSGKMVTRYSAQVHTKNPTGDKNKPEHFRDKSSAVEHVIGRHEKYTKTTTNTEVTSVTNEKRTLLSQLASLLGFKVNPVANAKKVCDNDDDGDGDMTENAWSDEARQASADARKGSSKKITSDNTMHGFSGTRALHHYEAGASKTDGEGAEKKAAEDFHKAASNIVAKHGVTDSQAKTYLDSKAGRHVADHMNDGKDVHSAMKAYHGTEAKAKRAVVHGAVTNADSFDEPDADSSDEPSDGDEDNKKKKSTTTNSSNGDDMDRNKLVSWLTTNCDCHKGKEKVLANQDNYTDEELRKLKLNAEKAMKNAQFVANASTDNPDEPDEDDDDATGEQKANDKGLKGIKGPKDPMKAIAKNMSLADFEKTMPVGAKAIWNAAKEVEHAERSRLVALITANMQDETRKDVLTTRRLSTRFVTWLRRSRSARLAISSLLNRSLTTSAANRTSRFKSTTAVSTTSSNCRQSTTLTSPRVVMPAPASKPTTTA